MARRIAGYSLLNVVPKTPRTREINSNVFPLMCFQVKKRKVVGFKSTQSLGTFNDFLNLILLVVAEVEPEDQRKSENFGGL